MASGMLVPAAQNTLQRGVSQVARRFDTRTAERLAELLADVDDAARLADVGDWIVDCATGDEMPERCSGLRDRRPAASS